MDNWYTNAVFYELYLRAFRDSDGDGHGDFSGLLEKLDYLEWLGVDCLWLLPFYPSPLRDDGYDIASYYGLNQTFGLMEDFMMMVQEIHRRGMRVVTDLVVNHTSDQHPWFKDARRSKDSPYRDYYVWSSDPQRYHEARIIFLDTEISNWAYDEISGEYYWHRFYSSQPDLNYDNPKVRAEMLKIVDFWLEMGIDGFRVDAVPYLYERDGTNCENLPETHDFVKELRAYVDANYPDRLLLAEANQWPHDVRAYFGDDDEFHMCFHFPVMPRLYKAVATADRTDVVEILANTPEIPPNCQWATFLRNHDELTLEMVTEKDRQFMWEHYAPDPHQRINLGIRRRLAPLMDNDRRKIELMNSMLFTLPGAPVLYYGDEIGMGDNVGLSDRNGVRTPMQWDDSVNGGFSSATFEHLYLPPISDPDYGFTHTNVAMQRHASDSLLHTVRQMIQTRKTLPVLAKGGLEWLRELPDEAMCFWRTNGEQRILALHNLSDAPLYVPLPEGPELRDALDEHSRVEPVDGGIQLPPYGYRWLIAEAIRPASKMTTQTVEIVGS